MRKESVMVPHEMCEDVHRMKLMNIEDVCFTASPCRFYVHIKYKQHEHKQTKCTKLSVNDDVLLTTDLINVVFLYLYNPQLTSNRLISCITVKY